MNELKQSFKFRIEFSELATQFVRWQLDIKKSCERALLSQLVLTRKIFSIALSRVFIALPTKFNMSEN